MWHDDHSVRASSPECGEGHHDCYAYSTTQKRNSGIFFTGITLFRLVYSCLSIYMYTANNNSLVPKRSHFFKCFSYMYIKRLRWVKDLPCQLSSFESPRCVWFQNLHSVTMLHRLEGRWGAKYSVKIVKAGNGHHMSTFQSYTQEFRLSQFFTSWFHTNHSLLHTCTCTCTCTSII